jgi:C_GCAxxG_C_C family probable redox protein
MLQEKAFNTAKEAMNNGYNCCQAVLIAAQEIWGLELAPGVLEMGQLFGKGIGSGCTCGALTGLVMVSGLLDHRYPHPLGPQLSTFLHQRFKESFGSTCCRVICSRRNPLDKLNNRGCKKLTGTTASLLVEVWEETIHGRLQDFDNSSYAK